MSVSDDSKSKYTELSREDRAELETAFRDLEKKYSLRPADLAFQSLSHAKSDGLMSKVRIVATQNLKAAGRKFEDDEYESAMNEEKANILKASGFDPDVKTNQLTIKMITEASIQLQKQFGDLISDYFDEKRGEKAGGSKEVKKKAAA